MKQTDPVRCTTQPPSQPFSGEVGAYLCATPEGHLVSFASDPVPVVLPDDELRPVRRSSVPMLPNRHLRAHVLVADLLFDASVDLPALVDALFAVGIEAAPDRLQALVDSVVSSARREGLHPDP